jgi:hypothetical protein
MTLPAGFPRPTRHVFDPDPLTQGATCLVCGEAFSFGALHAEPEPDLYAGLSEPPADLDLAHPGAPADLYGSTTDPDRCECGISLAHSKQGGWRTPGCDECNRRSLNRTIRNLAGALTGSHRVETS